MPEKIYFVQWVFEYALVQTRTLSEKSLEVRYGKVLTYCNQQLKNRWQIFRWFKIIRPSLLLCANERDFNFTLSTQRNSLHKLLAWKFHIVRTETLSSIVHGIQKQDGDNEVKINFPWFSMVQFSFHFMSLSLYVAVGAFYWVMSFWFIPFDVSKLFIISTHQPYWARLSAGFRNDC